MGKGEKERGNGRGGERVWDRKGGVLGEEERETIGGTMENGLGEKERWTGRVRIGEEERGAGRGGERDWEKEDEKERKVIERDGEGKGKGKGKEDIEEGRGKEERGKEGERIERKGGI